jgi:cytochrome oxidase Cu insertion factor (SCO1/SenC/PrrC family)
MRRSHWLGLAILAGLAGCLPGYLNKDRHMAQEGSLAPPITGIDADGQVMRLKDYAGKVVLVSFWHGA